LDHGLQGRHKVPLVSTYNLAYNCSIPQREREWRS
jgi:hypothetical protein